MSIHLRRKSLGHGQTAVGDWRVPGMCGGRGAHTRLRLGRLTAGKQGGAVAPAAGDSGQSRKRAAKRLSVWYAAGDGIDVLNLLYGSPNAADPTPGRIVSEAQASVRRHLLASIAHGHPGHAPAPRAAAPLR